MLWAIQVDNSNLIGGDRRAYVLARLKRDRQDLYARVQAGELTAHAAAIEAGFRQPTMTVRRDPPCVARAVSEHFTAAQLDELVALLLAIRARQPGGEG